MRQERKRLYEGMYILSATLSEEARKKALEKILNLVDERQGEVHKVHEMGRKRLAYPIEGKREGYYYVVYFTLGSQFLSELWHEYHLNEDLLRFMTLLADSVKESLEFQPLKQN